MPEKPKIIKPDHFPEKTTARNMLEHTPSNFVENSPFVILLEKLNCITSWSQENPKDSIMSFEQHCTCDSGFLCEHRLEYIVEFIQKNFVQKDFVNNLHEKYRSYFSKSRNDIADDIYWHIVKDLETLKNS
jgi:hypothetical protein